MPGHGGNRTYDLWNTSLWNTSIPKVVFFKLARGVDGMNFSPDLELKLVSV
jgi:hypothetical protein